MTAAVVSSLTASLGLDPASPYYALLEQVFHLTKPGAGLGAGAGQLVTSKYRPVSRGQYCLAATSRGQSVALTCDPCQDREVACIDLCCPHGEVGVIIPA